MIASASSHLSSALKSAACTASAQSPFLRTWVNITAATFPAANGPAVGNDHSNSRPKQNGG
jgi:hypothetical protein